MKTKNILENKRQHIVEQYGCGISTCEIARELDVNGGSVYVFLRDDCGVTMREKPKCEDYEDDLCRLYEQGMTCYAIAKQLGLNNSTCQRYCKKLGLDFSKNIRKRETPLKDQFDEILADYQGGMGCYRLSKKYNCNESSITRLLRSNDIDVLHQNKYNIPHDFFDVIDTEQQAYVLGFFTADGCNGRNHTFQLGLIDKDIIYDIRDAMGYDGPIHKSTFDNPNWRDQYKLNIGSKQLSQRLSELHCPPAKCHLTQMPGEQDLPIHLRQHYIRGVFDGDGSIHTMGPNCVAFTIAGSEKLLNDIATFMMSELDISCRIYTTGTAPILRVTRKDDLPKVTTWLYTNSTICLKRKRDKMQKLVFGV